MNTATQSGVTAAQCALSLSIKKMNVAFDVYFSTTVFTRKASTITGNSEIETSMLPSTSFNC